MHLQKGVGLTTGQKQVLDFISDRQKQDGYAPTTREIQKALGLASQTSVVQFVRALRAKGFLRNLPKTARGAVVNRARRVREARPSGRSPFVDVPLRGDIRAGLPAEASPQTGDTLPVHPGTMGLTEASRPFALRARGTSMVGKGILDGDYIVLDAAREPRSGDVVAALLDGESTLKTLVKRGRQTFLRAENPEFKELKPTRELTVQGVMVGLIRAGL